MCVENAGLPIRQDIKLAEFLKKKFHKNIIFVLPSLEISGGVMVTLNHVKYNAKTWIRCVSGIFECKRKLVYCKSTENTEVIQMKVC